MRLSVLVMAVFAMLASSAMSQGLLEKERQRIEVERKQMFGPSNSSVNSAKRVMPSQAEVDAEMKRIERDRKEMFDSGNPAVVRQPNVFPNVATPERGGINIEAIAKRYEQKAAARKTDELMVFASFSMPSESFKRLVSQTSQVGGVVVLRGFKNNSYKETVMAINQIGEASGSVLVNPNAFTKYKVKAVPSVVLAKSNFIDQVDQDGCALPDNFASVGGDVSLEFALEQLSKRAPDFERMASGYLRQLRGRQ